jgi:plastocyanin
VRRAGDPEHPFAFAPADVTVKAGSTVRWVNDADVFHTVTSTDSLESRRPNGLFDGSLFSAGDTFEFTFRNPGTYHYYCRPHSEFMVGTIRVTE